MVACLADEPIFSCAIAHRLGPLRLEVDFRLTAPWTLLFGPSGSGKSTILRTIAGFVTPDHGRILSGPLESVLLDRSCRVHVPPHRRPVRWASQAARLIPFRSVLANVRYGITPGLPRGEEDALVAEVMSLFRICSLAKRMPHHLSGGETQRVAVARAVASAVTYDGSQRVLLLLDEPFAGLDSALRNELAPELRDFLRRWKTPVLSVSHDAAEAYLLDAEVIRLAEGRIVQQGPVREVLAHERERILRQLSQ